MLPEKFPTEEMQLRTTQRENVLLERIAIPTRRKIPSFSNDEEARKRLSMGEQDEETDRNDSLVCDPPCTQYA